MSPENKNNLLGQRGGGHMWGQTFLQDWTKAADPAAAEHMSHVHLIGSLIIQRCLMVVRGQIPQHEEGWKKQEA